MANTLDFGGQLGIEFPDQPGQHLPETLSHFKSPNWNHWHMLFASTCDGGHHGWLIGSLHQIS